MPAKATTIPVEKIASEQLRPPGAGAHRPSRTMAEPSKEEKRAKKRQNVRMEILETERRYVDDVTAMVEVFVRPLKARSRGPEALLNPAECDGLFSSVEQLVRVFARTSRPE